MRVKGSIVTRRRHKKLLRLTKGYHATRSRLFRRANEAMLNAGVYAYRDRRNRKRDLRRVWITRINAAARLSDMSYSVLMNGLKKHNININRQMLADIAVNDPEAFKQIVQSAK